MTTHHKAIVHFIPNKCRRCYTCVPKCPAQAIRIHNGKAQIVHERCIACGTCIEVCSQNANEVKSDVKKVQRLINGDHHLIVMLSSSFPAAFPGLNTGSLITAIKQLGFDEVMEVAFGAELVAREYRDLIAHEETRQYILTCCPVVVDLIEKFYPQLLTLATPVVSPMVAMGRVIKNVYNPRAKVVFIGPCVAKKIEGEDNDNTIDAVLTFTELRQMFAAEKIDPLTQPTAEFSGPTPNIGRMYSLPGALLEIAGLVPGATKTDVLMAQGQRQVLEALKEANKGNIGARFLELFFCEGCISGPMMGNDLSFFQKKEIIMQYALQNADPLRTEIDIAKYSGIDLSRSFRAQPVLLPTPSESDLRQILSSMNMVNADQELNCGACGYQTCRQLATAIYQKLAEKEMCWPFLMETLENSQKQLTETECRRFYLEHIAKALEEEDKRIARELHDNVAQTLIAVLHQVENFLEDKDAFRMEDTKFLLKMAEEIHSVLQEVRQFSHDLRPAILDDLGLIPALTWLLRQHESEGLKIDLHFYGNEQRLAPDTELGLFRITQEAVRNIAKHASVNSAEVILHFDTDRVALKIIDKGNGFDVPEDLGELSEIGKLGLLGIQERARLLSGLMTVKSKNGEGTIVSVEVPLLNRIPVESIGRVKLSNTAKTNYDDIN